MSAYVLSWLNDELQLSNGPVNAIEREFASGYLFAEVIHKAHPKAFTVDDLAEFQNEKKVKGSTLASVKKHNAPLLKRALRVLSTKCGLSETKNTAVAEIMQEDRGTALRLLYQIRKSLEQQKLKSPIEKIPRLPKTELPADDVYWYGKGGHSEPLLKPFFDEERNQMVKILELEEQDETHILQNRDENRDYLLEKEVIRRQQMLDEDEFVLQFWRNTYRADVLKTTEEVRVEREVLSREQAAIDKTRKYYRGQALFGIDGYERNLQRIGIDTSENAGTDVPTKGIANPMQLLESMKTRLPTRKNLFLECLANMRKIKASGRARRRGAIEREKRRRKQRVQTALEAQDLASTNALKEDTGRFLKSMAFHQKNARITYLQRLCAEKEVEWRTQTQEENAGRRRSESDARWQVSTEKVREEHAAREPERRDNKDTFHMMEKDRQAFREEKHFSYCDRVLEDLFNVADLVFRDRQEKFATTGELPPKPMGPAEYRKLLESFVEMGAKEKMPRAVLNPAKTGPDKPLPVPPVAPIVDRISTDPGARDFFFCEGEWSPASCSSTTTTTPVGEQHQKLVSATISALFQEKHREVRIDARERFFARANGSSGGGNGSTAAIPVDLDKPEFDGGEETNLPNETNQDKPPRTAHLQYPSMEDIEFVLLTGPPQSGKKSVANLLKSENVFVLDYEQTLRKAHDAWLEFKVEPGGESAPGLPKPLQILLQSDPHTEGVFEEMKAELIDALDLPPPKKGDPVPGEGVAKKHLGRLPELDKRTFERLLQAEVEEVVENSCKPYLKTQFYAKQEKLEAELEELEAAVELAKGELEEVVNKAAAEQNGGAGEGDAENDKDTTIEPPPVDPSEEIARAAIAEKIVCAEKAVYDWRLKSKKKPKCYVLFVGSYYPGTVDETASFMRECIFPTFHLESPCTTKATQELASLCLPQANDAANTALAKEKRACAVLIPEVAASSSTSSGAGAGAQVVLPLPTLRKVNLSTGSDLWERQQTGADPSSEMSRLPETFFSNPETRTRCTVFPLRRAVGRPFVDRVFSGKLDLQTSAKSPFAPIAPHHGGKEVVRHVKTAGKSAEEIASEIATQMLPTEVFPATASSSSSSSSREASANYDTYGQIALVYQQTSLNLLTDLDTEEKQFFKELEELKTQFEKFMNARNEDLKGPIREATRAAVGSENEAERLSELLWAEADKRRKRAEEEFGKSYVQKASDWWSAKITALLLVMEKLLAAHWLFATELGDLVAQLVAGGGVDHKAFTKTEVSGARGTSSSSGSCSAVLGGSRQPGVEEELRRKILGQRFELAALLRGSSSTSGAEGGCLESLCAAYMGLPMAEAVKTKYQKSCRSTLAKGLLVLRRMSSTTGFCLRNMEAWIEKRVFLENETINKYMTLIRVRVEAEPSNKKQKLADYVIETAVLEECPPVPSFGIFDAESSSQRTTTTVAKESSRIAQQKTIAPISSSHDHSSGSFSAEFLWGTFSSGSGTSSFYGKLEELIVAKSRYAAIHLPDFLVQQPADKVLDFVRQTARFSPSPLLPLLFYGRSLRKDAFERIAAYDHERPMSFAATASSLTMLLSEDAVAASDFAHCLWPPEVSEAEVSLLSRLLFRCLSGRLGMWAFADAVKPLEGGGFELSAVPSSVADEFPCANWVEEALRHQAQQLLIAGMEDNSTTSAGGHLQPHAFQVVKQDLRGGGAGGEYYNFDMLPAASFFLLLAPFLPGDSVTSNFFGYLRLMLPRVKMVSFLDDGGAEGEEAGADQEHQEQQQKQLEVPGLDATTVSLRCVHELLAVVLGLLGNNLAYDTFLETYLRR
eukprot:CAMPEP_0179007114 /NCGR_PEP_ID=MMETSP0795-20121207/14962_1 /TAXON_ID=88552 /ORGANISM="Amoebophrya sp., Strain Ameob2" /LENGTH=1810 /DNA_ID=CAMNT_0020702015 /DNA_START=45 /DNA_END=5477 /DNA_ORIENTATION=+